MKPMSDLAVEPQTEVLVGEPVMKGFMRSLVYGVKIPTDLGPNYRADMFQARVVKPLSNFQTWVQAITPLFLEQGSLVPEQLGNIETRPSDNQRFVYARHGATSMEATGKTVAEAKARLADMVTVQLGRWKSEGNLNTQAARHTRALIAEYRRKLKLPW